MYQTDQYEGMIAETVSMRGHNGDTINAYVARPLGAGPFPGMVLIHHAPGWDEWYRECTRRFAHHGYVAISPNLYFRDGHGTPEDVGAKVRAAGGAPDARVLGDLDGANACLRSLPYVSRQGRRLRHLLGRPAGVPRRLPAEGLRRRRRLLGWARGPVEGGADAEPAGGPDRLHEGPLVPDPRPLRQRGQVAHARAGQPARGRAEEARQAVRVPPLRWRRSRLLLLRPPGYRQEQAMDGWKKVWAFLRTHAALRARERGDRPCAR